MSREWCECCGAEITKRNEETRDCPACGRPMCEECDMGRGTWCNECESMEDDDDDEKKDDDE